MEAGECSSDEDDVVVISPKPPIAISESDDLDPLNIQPPPVASRKHKHRRKDSKKHSEKGQRSRDGERSEDRYDKHHNNTKSNDHDRERDRHRMPSSKLGDLERERHRLEREHRHEERRLQHSKRHLNRDLNRVEGHRPRDAREHRTHSNRSRDQRPRNERSDRKYGEDHSMESKRRKVDRDNSRSNGDRSNRNDHKRQIDMPRINIAPPADPFEIIQKDPIVEAELLQPLQTNSDTSMSSVEDPEEDQAEVVVSPSSVHQRRRNDPTEEGRGEEEAIAAEREESQQEEIMRKAEFEDVQPNSDDYANEDGEEDVLQEQELHEQDQLRQHVQNAYKEMKDIPKLYSDEESEIEKTPITQALFQAKSKFDDPDEYEDNKEIQNILQNNPKIFTKDNNSTADEMHDSDDSDSDSNRSSLHEIVGSPIPSPPPIKLPSYFPAIQGCRSVEEFNCLNRIEEGTYGVVYRAKDKKTDEIVALKRLKMEKEKEGFPITSLREINTLLKAQHVNIVHVREIVVGSNMDKIFIVMDYVEHDMKCLMESMKEPFMIGEVKTLMLQLLRGVAHMHDNWIIHRDLKTSNLLLSHKGILKIGDFGLAREYGAPLRHYTPIVVTLWYRAPELLLGTKLYSTPIDMWSVGAIFAEFLSRKPLFPAKTEMDAINKIFKELGTPTNEIWEGCRELPGMKKCTFAEHPYNQLKNRFGSVLSSGGFNLINAFLTYDPDKRITAEDALKHSYFKDSPHPIDPSMFPTWPAKSEHGNKPKKDRTPKPPSGGQAYNKLMADDKYDGFSLNKTIVNTSSKGAGFALKF